MDFASLDNQYLVKVILFGLGLVANLVLNLRINREVLFAKDEKNYLCYLAIWLISALFAIIVLIFPESIGYSSLFYAAFGFSLPQLAIYIMTNNKLTKAMDSAYISLAMRDLRMYLDMQASGYSYEEVKKAVEDEMNHQVEMGTFSPEKGRIYHDSIISNLKR